MLASELSKNIIDLIRKFGDFPVVFDYNEEEIEYIERHEEFDKSEEYIDPECVKKYCIG